MNTDGRFTIKVWTYISNGGDGSASARFFNSEEEAEAYAEASGDDRFCDDISIETLEFDTTSSGFILLNPDKHRSYDGN
jgi:hypothetical protein